MTMCPNGHENTPGGRYCSTCAAELRLSDATASNPQATPEPPLPPRPPTASGWPSPPPWSPPPPPPGGPAAGSEGPWYHRTWAVGIGLVMCFPVGLWALWTHPTWSRRAKQRLTLAVAALVVVAAITSAVSPKPPSGEDDLADGVAGTQVSSASTRAQGTTTSRPVTTTTAATTTTVDREVLRAAYDAQVAASCETVAQASLAESDAALAQQERAHYDDEWTPHAPESRFLQDVDYCGHQRREQRRAAECGKRPEVELLARDPDQFAGQCFTVVMDIVQFDQGTGKCSFRARFDTVAHEWNFEYKGDNSVISYPEPCPQLDPLGADDVIRTRAVVVGGLTYDTTIGGSATAVQFVPVGDPEILADN